MVYICSFLSSDVSSLTDTERDHIDTEAQTVIKKCQQTIVIFKNDGIWNYIY